jgi:mycofactocin glycosyltransferase
MDDLVPVRLRLRPDTGTRLLPGGPRLAGGAVLVGGSPVRVLRLTAGGARQVAGWLDGEPVPDSVGSRELARRLLDASIVHPDFGASAGFNADAGLITARSGDDSGAAGSSGVAGGPGPGDVTVVIPVRDRYDELARCLGGLREAVAADLITARCGGAAGRGATGEPQLIVVDDCSADPAAIAAIVARAGARVIRRPVNGGPGAARNTGLAAAATGLVAFLDSDCVPAPGWLDALLPHFADPATGAVAPRIVPHDAGIHHAGRTWLARYEGASSTLDMGARPSIVRPGARVSYVPGAALLVRREAAGDGFQAGMRVGEDVDFVWRLAAAGWRVRYEPAAVMAHQHRVQLRSWFSRRVDYGTSAAILEDLHPGDVRPMYASWWTAGAWAAALAGRPRGAGVAAGVAITATATALLARRLSRVTGERWPLPARPAARHGRASEAVASGPAAGATADAEPAARGSTAIAWRMAARLAGGGTLAAARPLGSALSRTWWPVAIPLAVAMPRLRLPVAALVAAPPLLDWLARRPPLDPARYVAARLLDDAAYGVGVWKGCARRRQFRALLPVVGSRRTGAATARGLGAHRRGPHGPAGAPPPASRVQDDVGDGPGAADEHLSGGRRLQRVRGVGDAPRQQRGDAGVADARAAGPPGADIAGVG